MKILIIVGTILFVSVMSYLILRKDCKVSDWEVGPCSKTCGGGKQTKTRKIITNPALGGKKCPNLSEEISCNTQECPVDCTLGDPLIYTTDCSTLCGQGTIKAKKSILSEAKFGGQCNNPEFETECKIQDCSSTAPPITVPGGEIVVKPGQTSDFIVLYDLTEIKNQDIFVKNIIFSFSYGIVNPPTISSSQCNSPKLIFYFVPFTSGSQFRNPFDNEIIFETSLPNINLTNYKLIIPFNKNIITFQDTINNIYMKINSDNCGISLSNMKLEIEYAVPLR